MVIPKYLNNFFVVGKFGYFVGQVQLEIYKKLQLYFFIYKITKNEVATI